MERLPAPPIHLLEGSGGARQALPAAEFFSGEQFSELLECAGFVDV